MKFVLLLVFVVSHLSSALEGNSKTASRKLATVSKGSFYCDSDETDAQDVAAFLNHYCDSSKGFSTYVDIRSKANVVVCCIVK
jgi:hypothetical protein